MEERDSNKNVEYMIDCYSGRGKSDLCLLKRNKDSGRIYVISYYNSKKPYRDENGHVWRDADFNLKAFYGLDDDFVSISNEEAEALIKEQEETGKTEWYCPMLYFPDEGRPDTTLDFDPSEYEKTIDITEEEAEEAIREWEAVDDLADAQEAYELHGENAREIADEIGGIYAERDDYENAFQWYRKSAEEDWDWGMFHLAGCYAAGLGVPKDIEKAITWYRKAYEKQGDAAGEAANEIGYIYVNLPQQEKEAAEWFKRGADLGSNWAMNNLGMMYENGTGVEPNLDDALDCYRKAYEQMGDAAGDAANHIGTIYHNVFKDYEEAVLWYRQGAELYNDWAMFNLGTMYKDGLGVAKDMEKASECFLDAYDHNGDAAGTAADEIGGIYAFSWQDNKEAVEWYRRGAELGSDLAMHDLGWMYDNGKGVEEDKDKAMEYYRKAYDRQGKAAGRAACNIGNLYEETYREYEKALEWYRHGADLGSAMAMYSLGEMYKKGKGVESDREKAVTWYRKAYEEQGDLAEKAADAIRRLGGDI